MKHIQAGARLALIDDDDYDAVSQFTWCSRPRSDGKGFYVYRYIRIGPRHYKKELLHHFLMRPLIAKVDHRDGDGLNNQRANLRHATQQQNSFNQCKRRGASSRYKGVTKIGLIHGLYQAKKKWLARIRHNNKLIVLGYFRTQKEAAIAYNERAAELFGEFARINEVK